MRTNNLECKITLKFHYGEPDGNNVIYTKDAVKKAVNQLKNHYPIALYDSSDGTKSVIGTTKEPYEVIWDEDNNVCLVTINGILFYGGTECVVNEIEDGMVQNFQIKSFGLSTK